MTKHRDPDALIASYLADGMEVLPDRVADAVLDEVHRTRQRAVFGPWRTRSMFKTALGAAAVFAALLLGGTIYLGQRGQPAVVAGPSSSPPLQSSPTPPPQSGLAAEMTVPDGATTTLLADGRVLIAGGYVNETRWVNGSWGQTTSFDSAGLYDPATRTFTPTGSMGTARSGHTATLLSDGRVLVAGGFDSGSHELASAELYDPATGTFSPTGPMTDAGHVWTAVRLLDGRVLMTGYFGVDAPPGWAEIYDPSSGTFSPTAPMAFGAYLQTATLLTDGRVLFAGGVVDTSSCRASAEIFDPKTGTFSPTGSMTAPRWTAPRCGTATLLRDGRVLMMGGVSGVLPPETSAEIFDPKTGTFSSTGSPANSWTGRTATLLTDGRVLVAGGYDDATDLTHASAELYDPATGTFSPTGSMAVARRDHMATLLADGRVLVIGGYGSILDRRCPCAPGTYVPQWLTSAEIYDPASGTFSPAGAGS
jgi:Kelch motif